MIGGSYGFYSMLPYIIDIFVKSSDSNAGHICSGSLIAFDWVLTAAHCVQEKDKMYHLGAGLIDNTFKTTIHGSIKFNLGQTRRVERVIPHEDYNPNTLINDIALLKVRVSFKEDSNILLAHLPLEEEKDDLSILFKYCYTGGWGRTGPNNVLIYDKNKERWSYNEDKASDSRLIYLVLPLISNRQCRRINYEEIGLNFDVTSLQICTLYYPGRKSLCRGDSGSPLMCGSKQYGLSSWSYGCGAPRFGADVYTRVDKYLKWINDTIKKFENYTEMKRSAKSVKFSYEYYDTGDLESKSSNIGLFFVLIFNFVIVIIIR